jgi:ankyrin repeat protein
MFACQRGNVEVARLLLKKAANVHCRDNNGRTALHLAAFKTDLPEIVSLLASHGADPNATTELGLGPLHYTAILGFPKNAQALLEAGANPRLTYEGLIAVELAEKYHQDRVVKVLRTSSTSTK